MESATWQCLLRNNMLYYLDTSVSWNIDVYAESRLESKL